MNTKKIATVLLSWSLIVTTSLSISPQASAKIRGKAITSISKKVIKTIGGGKNAPHGKGQEAVQNQYKRSMRFTLKLALLRKSVLNRRQKNAILSRPLARKLAARPIA
jgi:hypothetical protein